MCREKGTSSLAKDVSSLIFTCVPAILLRYLLMTSKYQTIIANHVEVSTPMNSWKRVLEGLYLLSNNINPYEGDLLHETPLSLQFYKKLMEIFNSIPFMFITMDIISGILLYFVARRYIQTVLQEQEENKRLYANDISDFLINNSDTKEVAFYVLIAILYNPYTLFSCVGCSTTVFHNFFLSLFLLGTVYGNIFISSLSLGMCSTISLYPFVLIVPSCIYFSCVFKSNLKAAANAILFIMTVIAIEWYCSNFGTDFSYIKNVYGCILTVPDLQPNIGLFWYFFTEMFDHFRDLFIYSFQINATILYLLPLSIKFRKEPFLLIVALLFIITIFKSYPSVGDVGFVLSLIPCFKSLFPFCQQGFLVSVILLITSCLAPILWHLWIYCNSANANFYFGVTLAFAIALIFLVTDLLFAQVKRKFALFNGKEKKLNGEDALLSLE